MREGRAGDVVAPIVCTGDGLSRELAPFCTWEWGRGQRTGLAHANTSQGGRQEVEMEADAHRVGAGVAPYRELKVTETIHNDPQCLSPERLHSGEGLMVSLQHLAKHSRRREEKQTF